MAKDLSYYVSQVVGSLVMQTAVALQAAEDAQTQLAEKNQQITELTKQLVETQQPR